MAETDEKKPGKVLLAGFGGFLLGAAAVLLIVWLYRKEGTSVAGPPVQQPAPPAAPAPAPQPAPSAPTPGPQSSAPLPVPRPSGPLPSDLAQRSLVVPVQGIQPKELLNTFDDSRSQGRVHEAIDIIAPRNTPVLAVESGRVAKLFTSDLGGLTLYQFDPTETYSYYYAHLERYAPGIQEGSQVAKGQVIGYVGTSGNAGPDNPHLHFAIFKLDASKSWWKGDPVNPFYVFQGASGP